MKKNYFPLTIKCITVLSGLSALVCFHLNGFRPDGWVGTCAITSLTVFYHFLMRLAVGVLVPKKVNTGHPWFRPHPWEEALYRRIGIKKWKKHLPTYDPRCFSLADNSLEQVINNMCQAELVHSWIVVCSFLPLLFSLIFGEFMIFLLTSVAAACLDLTFVALQRSNRPRLVRLLEKQKRREQGRV